ncbi:MAG: hypothetical protein M3Y75_02445 [Actinomycetota bacterium]|nr:hypothetical protein [Actinomycetota bacterium]
MKRLFLAAAVLSALLIPAASAGAAPTGEYKNFVQCPLANPTLDACFYSVSTGGEVTTGKKTVPVKNPQVLQGGLNYLGIDVLDTLEFLPAKNGESLSKTPQPVPGGLLGVTAPTWWPGFLQDLFNETINNGFTGVTATVELAGPPSAVKLNLLSALTTQGTALAMPVKIKLSNPFLGNNCYIGSNSNPIKWNFTTGTTAPPAPNKPITGSPGELHEADGGRIIRVTGAKLVDNSFAVPGANGCGGLFSFLIDPFVNSVVGVPAPAGQNTAILVNNIELGDPQGVIESE